MKNLVMLFIFALVATTCNKDKDKEQQFTVPTTSGTVIEGNNIIRTQVVQEGKQAAVITYYFDDNPLKYNHQEWKIIFSTVTGATLAGTTLQAYYMGEPTIKPSYSGNVVTINYPLGKGIGDSALEKANSLTEAQAIVTALEIMNIFNIF